MSESCLACNCAGGCTLGESKDIDHYEAHITVSLADVDEFTSACREIGVKPIVLDLQKKQGGVMKDMMTSSTIKASYEEARAYVEEKSSLLEAKGFAVVRKKLETTPWNPRTPSVAGKLQSVPESTYFESHLQVLIHEDQRPVLQTLATGLGFHLSRNTFKVREDGMSVVMMTVRDYKLLYEPFAAVVEHAKSTLEENGFPVEKTIVEYAIWDTKINHDAAWTGDHARG